jgi:hypothetical protein
MDTDCTIAGGVTTCIWYTTASRAGTSNNLQRSDRSVTIGTGTAMTALPMPIAVGLSEGNGQLATSLRTMIRSIDFMGSMLPRMHGLSARILYRI